MTQLFLPMKKSFWAPSISRQRDCFGKSDKTLWLVKARMSDGFVRWKGYFEDRDDADAFCFSLLKGTLHIERELWRLPNPAWHPGIGTDLIYTVDTVVILTSGAGSGQTWTRPSDFSNTNSFEGIGGGGSGSCGCKQNGNRGTGGSGAEYRKVTNYAAGSSVSYTLGSGGASIASTITGVTAGNNGSDTIVDTNILIAKRGLGGTILNGSFPTAPAGGTGGTGGTGNNGGAGGTINQNDSVTGGGGAGGPNGAGNAGAATTTNNSATNGGSGDAGAGGSAGTGSVANTSSPVTGGTGGNGAEWTTAGSGGGGGAGNNTGSGNGTGGNGGNYGAGGGGSNTKSTGGNSTSGAGIQGLLVITYTPALSNNKMFLVMQ